jgi:hypothetical protein
MKNEETDKTDTIPVTKNDLNKVEWIIIGGKKKWKRNCPNCHKDMLYVEKCGCVRAIKNNSMCLSCNTSINNKKRNSWSGQNNPWYGISRCGESNPFYKKTHSEQTKEIIAENTKKSLTGTKRSIDTKLKISHALIGKPKSPEHKLKCIVNGKCGYIEWKRKNGILKSGYNPTACEYFNKLNEKMGWNLQHARNGGEIRCNVYFLDAYDKKNGIVVEYDEPYHYDVYGKLKEKDVIRMKYIINKFRCRFFRYKEETQELMEITDSDLKIG